MKIVSTRRSQVLAGRIAEFLHKPLVDVKWTRFPDGEIYLRTGEISDQMVIVGSLVTSDDLVELLLLTDVCSSATTTLVLPYMGYARQDKQFNHGEPLSARIIARTLGSGVTNIVTINLHEESIIPFFGVPVRDLSLAPDMAATIKTLTCKSPLILGPDIGAAKLAREIAEAGGWEADHLHKVRLSGVEVRIEPKEIPVKGRDVVIVDDIISTGGTQATAASMLFEQGAASISTVCVHGVLSTGAYTHLKSAGITRIVSSDTIESACSDYSAARIIADAINR
ncbi:MAG: ribose-phosphate diphosphokinase [Methanospirillum sp.]|uniref:ribose-phosphate diphosphokinase n=1 Tax=Methanospirillum sp. TaxID=45200 RepID=UPI0023750A6D|nr:ribose-phosphate diphosphokinase [Methanospirillum sp.]MDD1729914.1 ribose-phosphate diphosphokinase [Methanospirillum sp.]